MDDGDAAGHEPPPGFWHADHVGVELVTVGRRNAEDEVVVDRISEPEHGMRRPEGPVHLDLHQTPDEFSCAHEFGRTVRA